MSTRQLRVDRYGDGGPATLLLHGLGGTGASWAPLIEEMRAVRPGAWITVDLPGHGESDAIDTPAFGTIAALVAAAVSPDEPVVAIGHSLGGVVALALSSGWFGLPIDQTIVIGPKLSWTTEELGAARRRAARPVAYVDTAEEALDLARRVAGIPASSTDDSLRRLIRHEPGHGYRISMDPAASPTARLRSSPQDMIHAMAAASAARVTMTAGEQDPSVTLEELQGIDPQAFLIPAAGHSPHLEQPAALARAIHALLT